MFAPSASVGTEQHNKKRRARELTDASTRGRTVAFHKLHDETALSRERDGRAAPVESTSQLDSGLARPC